MFRCIAARGACPPAPLVGLLHAVVTRVLRWRGERHRAPFTVVGVAVAMSLQLASCSRRHRSYCVYPEVVYQLHYVHVTTPLVGFEVRVLFGSPAVLKS